MPSAKRKLSEKSRRELEAELARWKDELAGDRKRLGVLEKMADRVRREIQHDRARRDRAKLALKNAPREEAPRLKALDLALSLVGTVEHPAGSNRGEQVDAFQARFHMRAQPWCGAFVGYCAELGGGGDVSDRIVYTPYIYQDAVAHKNGLYRVIWTRASGWQIPGQNYAPVFSLVLFDFGNTAKGIQHVAALRERWTGGDLLTVEGNTSFGNAGSQDNGGAVARRERSPSLVHSVVSIEWPK